MRGQVYGLDFNISYAGVGAISSRICTMQTLFNGQTKGFWPLCEVGNNEEFGPNTHLIKNRYLSKFGPRGDGKRATKICQNGMEKEKTIRCSRGSKRRLQDGEHSHICMGFVWPMQTKLMGNTPCMYIGIGVDRDIANG
jgi:hypothetical protein